MVTDTYSKLMSMRSMLKNSNNYSEDLSRLIGEQQEEEVSERQKQLIHPNRSGSAPPTVEGSLNAVGELFNEEGYRGDPEYHKYYYANVNLNPRLPPPVRSKEEWRFSRGGGGVGGIGDRRRGGEGGLFSGEVESGRRNGEWGGDGLIGLPGLGIGSRQKSIADVILQV